MQFSKFSFAALLTLASSALSQVVVTETHTITVITVTVTPTYSTSTSTVLVTVPYTSSSRTSTRPSTITSIVTVTTSVAPPNTATPITTCPIPLYYQCGGTGWSGCTKCESSASCLSQNPFYYQCVTKTPQVVTVTSTIYRKR